MSAPQKPYAKLMNIATKEEDNVLMCKSSSRLSKDLGFEGMHNTGEDIHDDEGQAKEHPPMEDKEEIDFEENPFQYHLHSIIQ